MTTNAKVEDNNSKSGDKSMLNNSAVYKYETPFKGSFVITHCVVNGKVILKYGAIKIRHNIYVALIHINMIQTLKILTPKMCLTMSTYD